MTGNETRITRTGRRHLRYGRGATTEEVTELRQPGWLPLAFTALGLGAGAAAKPLAQWLVTLPRAPFKGPAELLTSLPEPWLTLGLLVAGALLGLFVGLLALHEELTVRVSDGQVLLTRSGEPSAFPRAKLAAAFRDRKDLVLLAPDGAELAREPCDFAARRLAAAFTRHGHDWLDADPYAADFRLWVPDSPGLPTGADALLKARAKALTRKDSTAPADRRELRAELARIGVYARDEKGRQYWRGVT